MTTPAHIVPALLAWATVVRQLQGEVMQLAGELAEERTLHQQTQADSKELREHIGAAIQALPGGTVSRPLADQITQALSEARRIDTSEDSDQDQCCGICITGAEVGVFTAGVAYAYPGCPEHDPPGPWVSDCGAKPLLVRSLNSSRASDQLRMFGPKLPIHPSVGNPCPACGAPFKAGDYTTLVGLGPGSDPHEQEHARQGRPYTAVAVEVHWTCATGQEVPIYE